MTDDPFLTLVIEALNLMHPRFAAAHGLTYQPAEEYDLPQMQKLREHSFLLEFYHQLRHLWDRAIPVKLGLGHVLIRDDDPGRASSIGTRPDLLFWRLGEHEEPDRRLAAFSLVFAANEIALNSHLSALARYRKDLGFPYAVVALVGRFAEVTSSSLPAAPGVSVVFFDTDRWQVVPVA
jgi:hypothetical protein